jgi:sec-independent protein translocase protein TatA
MHFGGLGGWEWIIILVIVIIIFGVGKLPEIGGALGRSIREFRESSQNKTEGDETANETKA